VRLGRATLRHAAAALARLLEFSAPADETLSRYFRAERGLGPQERGFIAEAAFAVLRRRRSLEAAAGSAAPDALIAAAAIKVLGLSLRSLEGLVEPRLAERIRAFRLSDLPAAAARADLPDWLWEMLVADYGEPGAGRIAQGMLNPAPLDLRVNLARATREDALARLGGEGIEAQSTPYSPAGLRLAGRPAINRHALFRDGLVEVQDEGSQILAWLLAPRRGEMVADYCAGAGGKALAIAMLMRGTGRVYAMDISARRLAALGPRAARAGVTNVHSIVLTGDNDPRAKRLAGKLDRVLVDAPCSGFGTLRRNPDLKWRHSPQAIVELAQKQRSILGVASRLVKSGGRLVYATCSILRAENEAIAEDFARAHPGFAPVSCDELLAAQRIELQTGPQLRLRPHLHGTDGFFAAAFQRRE
jgi:16S rRNA (cytosine967-C5)-methyltransferase